jgi:hypothetical protein
MCFDGLLEVAYNELVQFVQSVAALSGFEKPDN